MLTEQNLVPSFLINNGGHLKLNKQEKIMEKKIEDYLHLYLGCEIQYWFEFKTQEGGEFRKGITIGVDKTCVSFAPITIHGEHSATSIERRNFTLIKPLLRPLSDMKMDELIDFVKIDKAEHDLPYSEFEEVLSEIKAEGMAAFEWNDAPADKVFEHVRYLLSRHFDLFGLIEAGLALNKLTAPNGQVNTK